jgi:hypothetical protein
MAITFSSVIIEKLVKIIKYIFQINKSPIIGITIQSIRLNNDLLIKNADARYQHPNKTIIHNPTIDGPNNNGVDEPHCINTKEKLTNNDQTTTI